MIQLAIPDVVYTKETTVVHGWSDWELNPGLNAAYAILNRPSFTYGGRVYFGPSHKFLRTIQRYVSVDVIF